jgi:predicted nucleic acid-binding protein
MLTTIIIFGTNIMIAVWVMHRLAAVKMQRTVQHYVDEMTSSKDYRELMRTGKVPKSVVALRIALDQAKRKRDDKANKLGVSND